MCCYLCRNTGSIPPCLWRSHLSISTADRELWSAPVRTESSTWAQQNNEFVHSPSDAGRQQPVSASTRWVLCCV